MHWILRHRKKGTFGLLIFWFAVAFCYLLLLSQDDTTNFLKQKLRQKAELVELTQNVLLPVRSSTSSITNNPTPSTQIHNFHLRTEVEPTKPSLGFKLGAISNNTHIIIGITTIKRDGAEYLLDTIRSLLSNREEDGAVKFVIFIGETNLTYVQAQSERIVHSFPDQFRSGEIQVISPPESYYPQWNISLYKNFNDPFERIKWRSKQNLDQIFLMLHIYHLSPTYYLMMEDDVIATKGYDKKILVAADARRNDEWFYISFCSLGAIGKLFRRSTLPSYVTFIRMFWNRKPLDWLQIDYLSTAYCSYDENEKECQKRRQVKTPIVTPALFQHVGRFSSLKGKIQNLQDRSFNKHL